MAVAPETVRSGTRLVTLVSPFTESGSGPPLGPRPLTGNHPECPTPRYNPFYVFPDTSVVRPQRFVTRLQSPLRGLRHYRLFTLPFVMSGSLGPRGGPSPVPGRPPPSVDLDCEDLRLGQWVPKTRGTGSSWSSGEVSRPSLLLLWLRVRPLWY